MVDFASEIETYPFLGIIWVMGVLTGWLARKVWRKGTGKE